jgi:lipopolysaccharide transport system ATP-binding protein
MAEPAITIDGVSKRYHLGVGLGSDESGLAVDIERAVRRRMRRLARRDPRPAGEEKKGFWALRDVSFDVPEGQVLGIIGRNGAGKSTLLKILARITPPTEGRVVVRGNLGSLLEVGTGFHPELTGRENIYLNGTILGMSRKEIEAKFDEIVEFSEIGRFLDTPIKRYSSGMYVRLAFSVAAHLLPQILLLDEVLAVGDAAFQRKCLAKMQVLAKSEGHTIIFVSHNSQSVREVASRIVLFEDGRVAMDGPSDQVINDYHDRIMPVQHGGLAVIGPEVPRTGTGEARITKVALRDDNGDLVDRTDYGSRVTIALTVEADEAIPDVAAEVGIATTDGGRFLTAYSNHGGGLEYFPIEPGVCEIRARIDATLYPGDYVIDAALFNGRGATMDDLERVLSFRVGITAPEGSDDHYPWEATRGFVRPSSRWEVTEADDLEAAGTLAPQQGDHAGTR